MTALLYQKQGLRRAFRLLDAFIRVIIFACVYLSLKRKLSPSKGEEAASMQNALPFFAS